ncbi:MULTISPECIES: NRDE family protein [Halomonadaceae]|uniref:NRDE family protein n=1 Tax=Halomonadaceae TaxID=28256 RepID=UPI001598E524|nr:MULTISPECIES: NRDE family protein [Halomonas]QJQ96890.1 NRDE family protein [Halomonas sp. PA5]
MCLIAFDYRPGTPIPLRLIANRDERHDRATAALAPWQEEPDIIGGRDLEAGGSWLALHRQGRFAAVTNVRDPRIETLANAPSRGWLVRDALTQMEPQQWLERLGAGEAYRYGGFNLLTGDGQTLWHLHRGYRDVTLQRLPAGLYGLSNASLDTPWPKLELARSRLAESLATDTWPDAALEAMHDTTVVTDMHRLPDTGVGPALEHFLSSAFISGERYGTRATTWLEWRKDQIEISERRYGPHGEPLGETQLQITLSS